MKKYTKEHEWVALDGEIATIGITEYAAKALGDVVFVDLPEMGKSFQLGADMAVVESVKAASEVYAPISGEIVEVNENLTNNPGLINDDPYMNWFVKMRVSNPAELDDLIDEDAYLILIDETGPNDARPTTPA